MSGGSEETIRDELRQARARDHVHGAYLLEGGPGTGKREVAEWLARLLLCSEPGDEPCGVCHDCRLLSAESGEADGRPAHPDLKWVEPDGAFVKVDQVRDLLRELSLVANEGGRRVALIFGADRLNPSASNALLKTLEEPPRGAVLVLVADTSDGLPPTIRSRCVRLRLAPTPEEEIRAELAEGGFDEQDAWLASALSGGSASAARAWAEIHLEDAREYHEFLQKIASQGATEILDFAEAFRGGEPARLRAELLIGIHEAFARREAEEAAGRDEGALVKRWLDRFEAGQRAGAEMRRRNLNPQMVVEGLLMDLRATA